MTKAIYRFEYQILLTLLKQRRTLAGMTQIQCSEALDRPQSFMSDVERGVRRLDVIQVYDLCRIFGCDFSELMQDFQTGVERHKAGAAFVQESHNE